MLTRETIIVFAPIADSIVERVTARVLQAFERYTPPLYAPDKALSQKETADMLNMTPKNLRDKVKKNLVPPPFTGEGEYPMWNRLAIEAYMRGDWQNGEWVKNRRRGS